MSYIYEAMASCRGSYKWSPRSLPTHRPKSRNWVVTACTARREVCLTFTLMHNRPYVCTNLTDHITHLSRSCFMHIRDLRRIRPMLDFKTASTIATSIVHAKLDYCNSLFLNIDITQINRLQAIQNALARAVTKTPKDHHITPVGSSINYVKKIGGEGI